MKKLLLITLILFVSFLPLSHLKAVTDPTAVTSNISMNIIVLDQGNYRLSWSVREDIISIHVSAKTKGWLAIGFEPTEKMKDADMVIGYLDSTGKSRVMDAFSTGVKGPHPDDISLGGTNDLLSSSVSFANGWTTFNFERKFVTGDKFDKDIMQNKPMKVIWSYGTTSDIKTYHETSRGSLEINFTNANASVDMNPDKKVEPPKKPVKKPIDFKTFLWAHILLMSLTLLSMILAISMITVFKKKTYWFNIHKSLLYIALLIFIGGFTSAVLLVNSLGSTHFQGPHKLIGLIAMILSIFFLILNINHPWKEALRKKYRTGHIWIARTLITLLVINLFLGIFLAQSFFGM